MVHVSQLIAECGAVKSRMVNKPAALEDRRIEAVIRPLRSPRRKAAQGSATERFKFDPHHDAVRCPARKQLRPRNSSAAGKRYRADRRDCARCPLKAQCLPRGAPSRRVNIVTNHAAILRARRKRAAWRDDERAIYTRHRWQAEGAHGTAKTLHGLARAVRRGLENRKIQALLTAVAMNRKKLAAAMLLIWSIIENRTTRPTTASV
ncbi:transposase [Albidovulum sp.]|uniref:transposase n=1 Tax=Albidovulum sp. TaxID=1872424 RepID=UPI003D7DAD40